MCLCQDGGCGTFGRVDKHDEAVLTATPAAFLDRKSKAASLLAALRSPPEYPLSKGLTVPQAKAILDASFRAKPNFVRFQDDRFSTAKGLKGFVFYYLDDEKYGLVRWAVKNKEVSLQAQRQRRWVNLARTDMLLVQAALAVLEHVAKRIESEVLASTVAGWVTVREVSSERNVAKREAKELDQAIERHAQHVAYAADPKEALELASLDYKQSDGRLMDAEKVRFGTLFGKFAYESQQQKAALARKYFRYEDVPRAINAYDLDHPPVAMRVGNTRIGDVVLGRSMILSYGEGNTNDLLQVSILSDKGDFSRIAVVGEARGTITPKMISDATRILRGYGFVYLDVPNAVGHRLPLIDALREVGYVPFSDTRLALPPRPRANPARRARRR